MLDKLTIGIVAFNEENFILNILHDVVNQDYPHEKIEVLLVDSCSTDYTKQIMNTFKKTNLDFYSVQVLDNIKKNQASGWNVVINNFSGDVLVRIDAHARLTQDFSRRIMNNINHGEFVVGGLRSVITQSDSPWGDTLLQVEKSIFGSSINFSRRSFKQKYVKTMFHAAYRREIFQTVGNFNEALLRTEDNEFHYRIRNAGYKLLYDPTIISYQYIRSSFKQMLKQKYGNGFWIGKTLKICPKCLSLYHLIPGLFVLAIFFTSLLSLFGYNIFFILLWILYGFFAVCNMIVSGCFYGFHVYSILMPFMYLSIHVFYGVGTLIGIFDR